MRADRPDDELLSAGEREVERLTLAHWAYEGEVLGEEVFALRAAVAADQARRAALETMGRLERQMAGRLRALLVAVGGDPSSVEAKRLAPEQAAAVADLPWRSFLEACSSAAPEAIRRYRRLRELVDEPHRPILDEAVAHEEALRHFADASLSGRPDPAGRARRLLRHPHDDGQMRAGGDDGRRRSHTPPNRG